MIFQIPLLLINLYSHKSSNLEFNANLNYNKFYNNKKHKNNNQLIFLKKKFKILRIIFKKNNKKINFW